MNIAAYAHQLTKGKQPGGAVATSAAGAAQGAGGANPLRGSSGSRGKRPALEDLMARTLARLRAYRVLRHVSRSCASSLHVFIARRAPSGIPESQHAGTHKRSFMQVPVLGSAHWMER